MSKKLDQASTIIRRIESSKSEDTTKDTFIPVNSEQIDSKLDTLNEVSLKEIETALVSILGYKRAQQLLGIIEEQQAISSETYLTIRLEMNKCASSNSIKDWFGYIYYYYNNTK